MRRFDPETYYRTNDPALLIIAKPSVMTQCRMRGEGPAYIKLSGRVLYLGRDLNAYLDARPLSRARDALLHPEADRADRTAAHVRHGSI